MNREIFMSKISILEIIGDSSLAGAPRHLLSIIENLDLDKFKIHVITPPGPLAGEIKDLKRKIDTDIIAMRSRSDFLAIRKIRQHIKHIKPDVIHVHGTRAGALGRLAAIGLNIPVIYTEHLWTKHYTINNVFIRWCHMVGYWFLDLFTNVNIAVSHAVKEFLIDNNISRTEKIKVIYNGIADTNLKAKVFQSDKEFVIASVGTLNRIKGMQYLIRAMDRVHQEFPEAKLEIIGDGPFKNKLVKEVEKYKLKKIVKFVGFTNEVEKYLTKFDLYIQPSLSESFGLAIVQAMNIGLPVIATNTGGIPEVVTDGKSGVLVKPADSKELATAIIELLRNPKRGKIMGEMGRQDVRIKFNLEDMIDELESVYEEVVKNPAFAE